MSSLREGEAAKVRHAAASCWVIMLYCGHTQSAPNDVVLRLCTQGDRTDLLNAGCSSLGLLRKLLQIACKLLKVALARLCHDTLQHHHNISAILGIEMNTKTIVACHMQ